LDRKENRWQERRFGLLAQPYGLTQTARLNFRSSGIRLA
jgi:hypothetical protein